MKLDHINLTVTDVQSFADVLEKYFGLRRRSMDNDRMAFLRDDQDTFISVFKGEATYPAMFHIGFTRETVEEVNAIHAALVADGFAPQPPQEDHGRWTFYFSAPGGVVIEVQKFHQHWD